MNENSPLFLYCAKKNLRALPFLVIAIEVRKHCQVFMEIAKILSGLFGDEDDSISKRTAETGLFSIIQLCAHVESICGERFGSRSIRFGVYARVNARSTKNRDLELETGNHIYTIWGPKLDNERDRGCERQGVAMKDPRSTFPIAQTEGVASEGTACTTGAMDAVHNREGANANRTNNVGVKEGKCEGYDPQMARNREVRVMSEIGEISLPGTLVARCLSFFLDGVGRMRHPSHLRPRGMEATNGRMLNLALRRIFSLKMAKAKEERRRISGVRYMSLIPSGLHSRNITYPRIYLQRSSGSRSWYSSGIERIKLEISKFDRNRKEVTFGVICILLNYDPQLVEPILEKTSRVVNKSEGCKIWSRCDGGEDCLDRNRDTVKLYLKGRKGKHLGRKRDSRPFFHLHYGNGSTCKISCCEVCFQPVFSRRNSERHYWN